MSGGAPTVLALRRRVDLLERELRELRRQVMLPTQRDRIDHGAIHRDTFLAITVDTVDYPDPGSCGHVRVPIKFIDAKFSASAGWEEALSHKGRNKDSQTHQVVALNLAKHQWVPPGTFVEAFWERAVTETATASTDGEWWFKSFEGLVLITAELDDEMCGDDPASVSNAKLLSTGDEIDLTGATITNPRKHRGFTGAKVLLIPAVQGGGSGSGSGCTGIEYQVIDVEQREVCLVHGFKETTDPDEGCTTYATLKIAGEWCESDEPTAGCILLEWGPCTIGSGSGLTCDLIWTFNAGQCC